jgi:hypothetical protein
LAFPAPARALVMSGPVKPGQIVLGHGWPEEEAFRELLKQHTAIGGHFMDAPTWWDGHYSVTYLYRGREVAAQRMINDLNRLKLAGTTVMIVDDEGFENANRFHGTKETVSYDWNLSFSETRAERANVKVLPGMNSRQVRMVIYLGKRMDRTKLRVPEWMQPKPVVLEGAPAPTTDYGPACALQAIARAARND